MAAFLALNLPVVSLGGKDIFICKPGLPELVIHVGGQNEMGLILHQFINCLIERKRRRFDPVQICVF